MAAAAGLRLALLDPLHDFARVRETLLGVLAEYELSVGVDVEDAAVPFLELRLDPECAAQLVGQADGLAIVVSGLAPDDLDLHRFLLIAGPDKISDDGLLVDA